MLCVVALAAAPSACANLGYYAQSVQGHLSLMAARRPIDAVIADRDTPPAVRERLATVRRIRDFAVTELGLPETGSYRSYVDVDRPYVVWTVVATPEFSLEPKTWCFPLIGCVAYRGYYAEANARAYAGALRARGHDVAVNGVPAYSTLGWFDDPVPSTILGLPEYALAGVLFHELAHERLYVEDDSAFNEAFAVAVERAGVRRWLRATGAERQRRALARLERREAQFLALVEWARGRLAALYASSRDPETMRRHKAIILQALRARYQAASAGWERGPRYDAWFEDELNNAKLASVATYHELVPAFERLLARHGGDLQAFFEACERLGALPRDERRAELERLLASAGRERADRNHSGASRAQGSSSSPDGPSEG